MSDSTREPQGTIRSSASRADHEQIETLLEFWFDSMPADEERLAALFKRWFNSTKEDDRLLEQRFGALSDAAAAGKLGHWRATAQGRLALILLLDQLPRNRFRGMPAAFACDSRALELCSAGMALGLDRALAPLERGFFYMPMQHSESREVQAQSVASFEALRAVPAAGPVRSVLENFAHYAGLHRDIIERFGRFPHRNRVLGRESTDEERDFLAAGGPSFGQ